MKIRALRTIRTDVGNVRRGETTDKLSDAAAKSLIKRGLAELVDEQAEPKAEAEAEPNPEAKPGDKPSAKAKTQTKRRARNPRPKPAPMRPKETENASHLC